MSPLLVVFIVGMLVGGTLGLLVAAIAAAAATGDRGRS